MVLFSNQLSGSAAEQNAKANSWNGPQNPSLDTSNNLWKMDCGILKEIRSGNPRQDRQRDRNMTVTAFFGLVAEP